MKEEGASLSLKRISHHDGGASVGAGDVVVSRLLCVCQSITIPLQHLEMTALRRILARKSSSHGHPPVGVLVATS